jgi:hypothetical protein
LWLVVPVLTMFALSLRRPLYNPKFLLVAAPAFCLLLANGLGWLLAQQNVLLAAWRRLRAAGGWLALLAAAVMLFASWQGVQAYYHDARFARDNYRGAVQTIAANERAGDAIILNAPGQTDIVGYYYAGALPIYALPRQRPLDLGATLSELVALANQHQRLWVVYYGDQQADPQRVIASWLEAHTYKASDRWFGNVRLVLYALPSAQAGAVQSLDVRLGDAISLTGYRLDQAQTSAGEVTPLTLFWQTTRLLAERYTVFAHVIDRHNALWGQRDSEPGGGLRPTNTWQAGEQVQDNYGLPVLAGTPPGEYQIEIGLYRADTGQRLPVSGGDGAALGDRVLIGPLTVARPAAPPTAEMLGMQHPSAAVLGGLRLLGYSLGVLGQDAGATTFSGTDILHLTLFWQSPALLPDLTIVVQTLDSRGQVVRQRVSKPVDGEYPTNGWSAGEVVRDQHRFGLDGLAAGSYRLAIEVREESGRKVGQFTLAGIRVK